MHTRTSSKNTAQVNSMQTSNSPNWCGGDNEVAIHAWFDVDVVHFFVAVLRPVRMRVLEHSLHMCHNIHDIILHVIAYPSTIASQYHIPHIVYTCRAPSSG